MNFISLGMKVRRLYIFYKTWLIFGVVAALLCPSIFMFHAYRAYSEAAATQAEVEQLKAETKTSHELVKAYDEKKTALLQRTKNNIHEDIWLYHILVETSSVDVADKVRLESVQLSDDEFTIKGRSGSPEAGHRYVQRLKAAIKGVTITDKQGIDSTGQMATFEVHGSFKRTKDKS